jgi:hypothetical protein
MTALVKIFSSEESIDLRLKQLGLTQENLKYAVAQGQASRNNATPHHPANAAGTFAYFESVRSLRDSLVPEGWVKQDVRNLSMTVNPKTNIAIAVSGGSKETGFAEGHPTTRNPKGQQTKHYLTGNQRDLFQDDITTAGVEVIEGVGQTWLLIYFFDAALHQIRSELSLPTSIDSFGRVGGWSERIVLNPIPLDSDVIDVEPDYTPDIDIDIQRHA